MPTKTVRLIRDGEGVWKGYGGGGRGILYTYRCTVTTRMTAALRWAAMRAILMFHVRDKVTRQCPQTTPFEEKGEPKRTRTKVPLLTSLSSRPNRLTSVYTRGASVSTDTTRHLLCYLWLTVSSEGLINRTQGSRRDQKIKRS